MANRIKGITIEIGGDTTGLKKALSDVDKSIRDTQSQLKDVERLLKIDPGNTELLIQKQKLLTQAVADTKDRLETLREAEKQVQEQFKQGKISEEQYDALKREIVATEQAEKDLSGQLLDTKNKLDDQNDSLDKGVLKADLVKDALIKLGEAVYKLGKDAVDYNAQMETYMASFTSFLGSAQEAEAAIQAIKEDASTMPFGSSDLIEANRALITAGESAEKSRENIKALASAVAATGGGNAELTRMATNLQQIKNTGKATSVDIKQFANAGINIYGLLSDASGKSIDQIKEMDISYDLLTDALIKATEEGGRYYGAMEAQGQTYSGQLTALKAKIQDSLGTTFQSVSDLLKNNVFPAINNALDSINFEKVSQRIGAIIDVINSVLPVVNFVVGTVISLIGSIIDNLSPVFERISGLLDGIIDLITNVFAGKWKAAWDSIVKIAKNLFGGIADTLIGIINSVIDALNKVISWFNGNSSTIGKITNTSQWKSTSTLPPVKKVGKESLWAAGGVISHGSAVVGENGAELLTMNGGVATLQPINNQTTNLGGINMSVYGAAGQNVNDLADVIMDKIQIAVTQKGAVWA